jgi:hypothetical protein
MSSTSPAASLSLSGPRLKAQLDASRRPPHGHHMRRVVSSNSTPRKTKGQLQLERPKTVAVAGSRSRPCRDRSPCRTPVEGHAQSPSPEKCAAPTPPPSRSNSAASPSPKRRTPSKLKLRDSLSPMKVSTRSPFPSRSSPVVHVGVHAERRKRDDPRLRARASSPKRTPPKLKLRRSTPTTDLGSLGLSPSLQKSPAKSPTSAGTEEDSNTPSPSTRKMRRV